MKKRPFDRRLTAPEFVGHLLNYCQAKFYKDHPMEFAKQRKDLTRMVITWPAKWLHGMGVSLPPEQYRAKLIEILDDAWKHQAVKAAYPPAYLATCVQRHFEHQGDRIYEAGKAWRDSLPAIVGQLRAETDPARRFTEELAATNRVLTKAKRGVRIQTITLGQKELF